MAQASGGRHGSPDVAKIKLCIVSPWHWASQLGGAEYQMQLLASELAKRGRHEVSYLARHIEPSGPAAKQANVQVAKPGRINRYGLFFDSVGLYRALRRLRPDVIYQRVGCSYTGVVALYARRFGCRAVWHVAHDGDVVPETPALRRDVAFRFVEKKALEFGLRSVESIVVQTASQAELLFKHYDRRASVQIGNFHPLPTETIDKSSLPLTVLWVANLKAIKQPEIFVRLAGDLGAIRDVRFLMLGKADSNSTRQSAFLADVAATGNLHYLGSVSQAEVNQHFATAHLLVNTSVVEGFSNTFIQAWMRKVPVLSLSVDPDGVIAQHGLGLVGGDYPSLLSNTRQLLENDAVRTQMGERAQAYALANHSMTNVDRLIELLS